MRAQQSSNAKKLKHDFNLSDNDLKLVFTLPHITTQEPYVKSFQYKVLNSTLFTKKLDYLEHDKCTFCKTDPETLHHFFFFLFTFKYAVEKKH